jgi:nitrogen fixation protein NifU and related proteins
MSKDDLEELGSDLYQELLLDHYKNPRNAGSLSPADIDHDGDNPTCGDMVQVYARLDKEKKIREIKFRGKGCAISQASASIFYDEVRGKTIEDVRAMDIKTIQDLLGIQIRPARVKCATLPLVVLHEGIKEFEDRGKPKKAIPGFKR